MALALALASAAAAGSASSAAAAAWLLVVSLCWSPLTLKARPIDLHKSKKQQKPKSKKRSQAKQVLL